MLASGAELDFFLSISSLAQVLGWRGQSNYAGANAFLEGLARAQRAHGIPGVCLNLGMLGEAGFVARSEAMTGYLESAGWLPLANGEALRAVRTALASENPNLTYAAADWPRLRASEQALAASPRLAPLAQGAGDAAHAAGQSLAQLDAAQRAPRADAVIRQEIAAVLRLEPDKSSRAGRSAISGSIRCHRSNCGTGSKRRSVCRSRCRALSKRRRWKRWSSWRAPWRKKAPAPRIRIRQRRTPSRKRKRRPAMANCCRAKSG